MADFIWIANILEVKNQTYEINEILQAPVVLREMVKNEAKVKANV
jgi:hypothetical protein